MITISLCMIVKNEEKTIERCLNSVQSIVDEIIIVDTGSTDQTKQLCLKYTNHVLDFQWVDDFSIARNFSYQQATMDYIMWLDADDILLLEDQMKFKELKKELPNNISAVMMKYNTGFDLQGNVTFSYYRERLSKRSCNFVWKEPVHEYLEIRGTTMNSDICITHGKLHRERVSSRNIDIYERVLRSGSELTPRGTYYYARELINHNRHADAIKQLEKFLQSNQGWKEDNVTACGELAKCYQIVGKPNESLTSLFRSFSYDIPRAEICCQIGYHYLEKKEYILAAYWFEFILTLKKPEDSWGFIQPDCWDYIPLLECAVCYDRLGDYRKASEFNERSLQIRPNSIPAMQNQIYFRSKMNERS